MLTHPPWVKHWREIQVTDPFSHSCLTLQLMNNKTLQIRSSQKQRKQLVFTCCLCQQDDEKGQTGAFCSFLINRVLKLQHLICSPRKSTPLTCPGFNLRICVNGLRNSEDIHHTKTILKEISVCQTESELEKYINTFSSIKQHLQFFMFLICNIHLPHPYIWNEKSFSIIMTMTTYTFPLFHHFFSSGCWFGLQIT